MISQCMIVKNEEHNIKRALSWAKDIVHEQIVVDTGSTDRTVEIAKQMGATVYEIPWEDDFSKAKNYCLEKATGKWILFFDADEYIQSLEEVQKLKQLLPRIPRHTMSVAFPLVNINEKGEAQSRITQIRVFRNQPEIRYRGLIHESLIYNNSTAITATYFDNLLTILHTGYSKEEHQRKDKVSRNTDLLHKLIEEKPDDYNVKTYFALNLIAQKKYDDAVVLCKSIFKKENFKHVEPGLRVTLEIGLMQYYLRKKPEHCEEALLMLYNQGMSWNASHPDYDLLLGNWYLSKKDTIRTKSFFERAYSKLQSYNGYLTLVAASSFEDIANLLISLCKATQDLNGVVKYSIASLKTNKNQIQCLMELLYFLKDEIKTDNDVMKIMNILSSIYDFSTHKDRIMVFKCAEAANAPLLVGVLKRRLTQEDYKLIS